MKNMLPKKIIYDCILKKHPSYPRILSHIKYLGVAI